MKQSIGFGRFQLWKWQALVTTTDPARAADPNNIRYGATGTAESKQALEKMGFARIEGFAGFLTTRTGA